MPYGEPTKSQLHHGAPRKARTHRARRAPDANTQSYEQHGLFAAGKKSRPLTNALGIKSPVAKSAVKARSMSPRTGKWNSLRLAGNRLQYRGLDAQGNPVWA